jgi:superoxide dismutase, Cu-Zn family
MRNYLMAFALGGLLLMGCEQPDDRNTYVADDTVAIPTEPAARTAVASMEPTEGNNVSGTVSFTEEEQGIRVVANLTGFPGAGSYGFHVHEHGDCSAPDAMSAGGHFDPHNTEHGGPTDPPSERHAGDLGNIEADDDGSATYDRMDRVMSFDGDDSIIGRSVIVHAEEDDLETQPTGDAGARLACGVIEMQEDPTADPPEGAFQDETN